MKEEKTEQKYKKLFELSYNTSIKVKERLLESLKKYKICRIELKCKIKMFKEYQAQFNSLYVFSREELFKEEIEVQGYKVIVDKVNLNLITFVGGDLVPAFYNSEKKELTEREILDIAELKALLGLIGNNLK